MAQKLIQTQEQKQVQVQRLTQQQMMLVKMLEMPLTELEQSVSAELDDNPALESCDPDKMDDANGMMDMHDGAEALAEELEGFAAIPEAIKNSIAQFYADSSKKQYLYNFFKALSKLCAQSDKPIVLMIDEVDNASNSQVFTDFLAQLRAYYLVRDTRPY